MTQSQLHQSSSSESQAASCDHVPNALTVEQALNNILCTVTSLTTTESLPIRESLGRVLAEDIVAQQDLPPHRNSAMDGYAIQFSDLSKNIPSSLTLVGRSLAGHPYTDTLKTGECVRIMTGAVVPNGADTVVMQEQVSTDNTNITFPSSVQHGQNVRHPGEDVKAGDLLLQSGIIINAANLGLLASLGIGEVKVRRKPRIAFFSTGDELKNIGQPLGVGDIYDSNRYTLFGLLKKQAIDIMDMGVIPDQADAIEQAFVQASQHSDVLITSGGVSVGDADFVSQTLAKLGQVNFWKIAMKPGKPVAFGKLDQCLFFGLPGNPVSVMATFLIFVLPALKKLQGLSTESIPLKKAICDVKLKKAPGRKDHQRGIYHLAENGVLHVTTVGLQSSHVLSAMSYANCFIVLAKDQGNIEAGSVVEIMAFDGVI